VYHPVIPALHSSQTSMVGLPQRESANRRAVVLIDARHHHLGSTHPRQETLSSGDNAETS
jgi:hypothetical protein